MARQEGRWVRQLGSGKVYTGAGWLTGITVYTDTAGDYCRVYDGADAVSGKRILNVVGSTERTRWSTFGNGFRFEKGLYLDMTDTAVEATVLFEPDI